MCDAIYRSYPCHMIAHLLMKAQQCDAAALRCLCPGRLRRHVRTDTSCRHVCGAAPGPSNSTLHCTEASKTKQAIDKLRSEVSAAEEAKRVSQCEAAAAREEAEKARLSREDAVVRLQRAAEAAADGTEEAMRVVHEYDVATQQQQVPPPSPCACPASPLRRAGVAEGRAVRMCAVRRVTAAWPAELSTGGPVCITGHGSEEVHCTCVQVSLSVQSRLEKTCLSE